MRKSKFPWDFKSTSLVIKIYGDNIEAFQSRYKNQTKLWSRMAKEMADDETLPVELREKLNFGVVQRRWNALKREFKNLFYDSLRNEAKVAPADFIYYDQMYSMFMEYANSKLTSTLELDGTLKEPTYAEISACMMNLLGGEDLELDDENWEEDDSAHKKASKASQVLEQLTKMPKNQLCVQKAKLRIEPNTPFNRNYQLSTIIDNQSADFKRKLEHDDIKPVIKKRSSGPRFEEKFKILEDIQNYQPDTEEIGDQIKEAKMRFSCSETQLSGINSNFMRHSNQNVIKVKRIGSDVSSINSSSFDYDDVEALDDSSIESILKPSKSSSFKSENHTVITIQETSEEPRDFKTPNASNLTIYEFIDSSLEISEIQNQKDLTNSMNIPVLEMSSIDGLRAEQTPQLPSYGRYTMPETYKKSTGGFTIPIVPRKLDLSSSLLNDTTPSHILNTSTYENQEEEPPSWFKSWMAKYDNDMRVLNAKIRLIDSKLDRILTQKPSPADLKSVKITNFKKRM